MAGPRCSTETKTEKSFRAWVLGDAGNRCWLRGLSDSFLSRLWCGRHHTPAQIGGSHVRVQSVAKTDAAFRGIEQSSGLHSVQLALGVRRLRGTAPHTLKHPSRSLPTHNIA